MDSKQQFSTIDEYIALQDPEVKKGLKTIRALIKKAAPKSTEVISYSMPAFKGNKVLVWFAACKNHYGFYPYPASIATFKDKLKGYTCSKGAIRFPYDESLPEKLIIEIVKFRVKEDQLKAKSGK
jgi:uncharacterized protein YdhG (YjbR/CyaY superfamily)